MTSFRNSMCAMRSFWLRKLNLLMAVRQVSLALICFTLVQVQKYAMYLFHETILQIKIHIPNWKHINMKSSKVEKNEIRGVLIELQKADVAMNNCQMRARCGNWNISDTFYLHALTLDSWLVLSHALTAGRSSRSRRLRPSRRLVNGQDWATAWCRRRSWWGCWRGTRRNTPPQKRQEKGQTCQLDRLLILIWWAVC